MSQGRFNLIEGRFEVAVASDVGGRYENQDYWLVDDSLNLLLLADGLGGLPNGAQASRLACETVQTAILEGESLEESAHLANYALELHSRMEKLPRNMGSTMVALHWAESAFDLMWVGDTFALSIFEGKARSLTLDHSQVVARVRQGELTQAQALADPLSNLLTQALGPTSSLHLSPGLNTGCLRYGERILIASDGLMEVISPKDMASIASGWESAAQIVDELMWGAASRGVTDNVTVMVGLWRGEDTPEENRLKELGVWSSE